MSSFYDLRVIVSFLALLTKNFTPATASDETRNQVAPIQMNRVHLLRGQTTASVVESHSESLCTAEMKALYAAALRNRETWARQMWDASTKMQSGILQGNNIDLGMFQQCVRVNGSHKNVTVKGRHCMVVYSHDSGTLTSSVCLPSSCNETHALEIGRSSILLSSANNSLGIELQAVNASCEPIESKKFNFGEILVIILFSSIGAFMLLCTIFDFVERGWPGKTSSAVALGKRAKFSLYTNTLALFDTRMEPGTIPALNGIRFLSICLIIGYHQRLPIIAKPMVNASQYSQWFGSWSASWFHMSIFATDNFFLMSGFLLTYFFLKKMRSGGKHDVLSMYFHRYVRLTPCIIVVGLCVGFLFHRMGSGPMWGLTAPGQSASCKKRWWVNLLYIQNFLTKYDICVTQSWYLAADMQLFVLSPLVLYPLHRWPKYGLSILGVLLLASIVAPALVIGLNRFPIVGKTKSFDAYHVRFYTRAFPYLAGMLLAYFVVANKKRLSKMTVILGWVGCCVVIILCWLAIRRIYVADYNLAFVTSCAALSRQSWSIAMSWVIYAIVHGHGGVFARFLSVPIFQPLSRISFGIYLTHAHVMSLRYGTTTIPGIFEEGYMFEDFLGILLPSMAAAALLYLFVEKPVMIAESIFKTRPTNQNLVEVAQNGNKEAAGNETLTEQKSTCNA